MRKLLRMMYYTDLKGYGDFHGAVKKFLVPINAVVISVWLGFLPFYFLQDTSYEEHRETVSTVVLAIAFFSLMILFFYDLSQYDPEKLKKEFRYIKQGNAGRYYRRGVFILLLIPTILTWICLKLFDFPDV